MQVNELHRVYRIQKMLMKDMAHYRISSNNEAESLGLEGKCRVNLEIEYDQGDLELRLGPRSYYQKKIKPGIESDNSSSSRIKGGRSSQKWGPETPLSNPDRLNSPPWLFQALTLNMTTTWLIQHPNINGMILHDCYG